MGKEANTLEHVASARAWLVARRDYERRLNRLVIGRWVPPEMHHAARALWREWAGRQCR